MSESNPHQGFYGNGEPVEEEVPWFMFTADHCPHWSIHWAEQYPDACPIPEGGAYLSNRPLTQAEKDHALTIAKAI